MSFPLVELSHVHRWWLLSQDILDFAAPAFLRNVNLILTFDYVASLPNGLVQPRMLKAFGWVLITFFFYETLVTFIWKLTILEKEKKWTTVSWESQQELKFPSGKGNWVQTWELLACSIYFMMVLLIFAVNYLYNTDGCVAKQGRIQIPKSNTLLIRDHSITVRIQAMKIWK